MLNNLTKCNLATAVNVLLLLQQLTTGRRLQLLNRLILADYSVADIHSSEQSRLLRGHLLYKKTSCHCLAQR